MLHSTRHHTKDMNPAKVVAYHHFLDEYSRVCLLMIDDIWGKLPEDLSVSDYLDYKPFSSQTDLSARALSSAITQCSGIVRASIEKQRRRMWVQKNRNPLCPDVAFSKPVLSHVNPNLSSKCCDIQKDETGRFCVPSGPSHTGTKFWGFVKIKSLGKSYGTINIPIIKAPQIAEEFTTNATLKSGVLFSKDKIQLTWETKNCLLYTSDAAD